MQVISFTNPKGGSGKTTSAFLLAEQISLANQRVGVLDLDPNRNVVSWAERRDAAEKPKLFEVYGDKNSDELIDFIEGLSEELDYLIIDLEGTKNEKVTFAILVSDLCVIPLDGSPMEAKQAAQAVKLISSTAKASKRSLPFCLLFTRTNAAFQTSDERDVRKAMSASKIPTLPVRIAKRAAYTRIFRDDLLLSELSDIVSDETRDSTASVQDKAAKSITSATKNAKEYAQSVINFLIEQENS